MKQKVEPPRMLEEKQFLPPLPDDPHEAAQEIEKFASLVFGHIQIHRCLIGSCGKPPGGKNGCFGLLVPPQRGTKKHAHISLWPIIPLREGINLKCMFVKLCLTIMMRI